MVLFKKRLPPVGSRPGTLAIQEDSPEPRIRVKRYTIDQLEVHDIGEVPELKSVLDQPGVKWVDVQGLGNEKVLRDVAAHFNIHAVALEDVVNVPTRPTAEEFEHHIMVISRMAYLDETERLELEQISLFIGPDYVVTFQEKYGDVLDPVRKRIRKGKGPIRKEGADYLAYAILDTIIESFYPLMEHFGNVLESLEDRVFDDPSNELLREINGIRRELITLRRGVWPQRDVLSGLVRAECQYFGPSALVYLRDTYDDIVQLVDVVEAYREVSSGLLNTYLSAVANKTNDVMKVLTIMASIFIPLTFMAGIYGMNFEHMPELHYEWAYPSLLIAMVVTCGGMVWFFWYRGWIGRR